MNEHDRYQELISRMLDEELTPEEQTSLAMHLKECPECAAVYAAFSALSDHLGADLEEPPERLRENVMAQIRREEIRKKNTRRNRWITYVSVAAMLVLVIAAFPRLRDNRADLSAKAAGAYQQAAAAEPAAASDEAFMEEAEAAADSAAFAMEAPAQASEANQRADGAMTEADAPVYELSGRFSLEELIAFLGGGEIAGTCELPADAQALCVLVCDEGEISVCSAGGQLYYTLPNGDVFTAVCDAQALLDLVQG